MFSNIGGKIKTLAQVVCGLGIGSSIITGFVLMLQSEDTIIFGIIVLIFGPLFSWISSFMTFGFGQLIENSDMLVSNTNKNAKKQDHKKYVEMLENAILCNNCGADISNDDGACHVCGKYIK